MESAEAPAPCPTQEQAWKNAGMGHQNPCLGEGHVSVYTTALTLGPSLTCKALLDLFILV
jgi:hypothetical protein